MCEHTFFLYPSNAPYSSKRRRGGLAPRVLSTVYWLKMCGQIYGVSPSSCGVTSNDSSVFKDFVTVAGVK
jgi:hypothetical protein